MTDKKIQSFVEKNSNRIQLEDHIPLKFPLALTIEPTSKCNFSCRFCPNGDKELQKQLGVKPDDMSLGLYKKIINDLSESGAYIKSLSLHKDGEPLLNTNLGEMIRIARQSGCFDSITVTTNGSLLEGDRASQLLNSGLTHLRISIESIKDERFKWITQTKYKADRVYENIQKFKVMRDELGLDYPRIYVKMVAFPIVEDELDDFVKKYEAIADDVNIETPMNWNGSGEKNFLEEVDPNGVSSKDEVFGYYENSGESGSKFCCPLPWYSLSITQEGHVGICGVDWNHETIIGDVSNEHLIYEIWNGENMIDFRKMHVENNKHMRASCVNCEFLNSYPDNIDDFVKVNPEKALGKVKYEKNK